ncbi:PseG/SpsG family protein [Bacteroidota bacterium]
MKVYDVLFCTNANQKIGSGHLMRSKILANELAKLNLSILFFLTDNSDINFSNHVIKGFPGLKIGNSNLLQSIKRYGSSNAILIVDSDDPYFFSDTFQKEVIALGLKLMHITIDPSHFYRSHIVLNPNIIAQYQEYQTADYTKRLFGPRFFIFRENFRKTRTLNPDRSSGKLTLFLAFGGSDFHNLTTRILHSITSLSNFISRVHVIIGPLNLHLSEINKMSEQINDIDISCHVNVPDIENYMLDSDIAITSCGTTFWELAALNIPTFCIAGSEREKSIAEFLHREKYTYSLGEYDNLTTSSEIAEIIQKIHKAGIRKFINSQLLNDQINLDGVSLVADTVRKVLIYE